MNNTNMSDKELWLNEVAFAMGKEFTNRYIDPTALVGWFGTYKLAEIAYEHNSSVIANMQKTIEQKDALIEQMRNVVSDIKFGLSQYNERHPSIMLCDELLNISSPVSEKEK